MILFWTQYITQIVQIQTQHTHAHDRTHNELILMIIHINRMTLMRADYDQNHNDSGVKNNA